jgi:branched-chain amino acid transport system ATP-binding protein
LSPRLRAEPIEDPAPTRAYEPMALHDVATGYGRIEVLHGVDVAVRRGAVTALLGPNGAGKSTTLGAMSGLLTPWRGCRHVEGRHVNQAEADELARIGVCHIREGRSVFPNLSVADNLSVAAACGADHDHLVEVAFTLFPVLKERRRQLAGTLSGGERQMLALGRALMAKPKLLVLDEPSLGLAPLIVREIFRTIASLRSLGVSVLLVEQNARAALETADYGYVLETGEIIQSGPADSLIHDPKLIAAYLGGH